jgi:hypothetical protein
MSDLDDVHSTLEDVDSRLRDVDSKLGDVHSKLEDIESTLEKIHDAHSKLEDIPSTLDKILDVLKDKPPGPSAWDMLGVIFLIAAIAVSGSWSGSKLDRFTDRCWYSVRYEADWANVHIERRPSDCDFIHAPLGSKRCSYKKSTNIFADDERKALVERATTPQEKQEASQRPNLVMVYWEKEDEP